ncbi:uncharacterized protein METZ01_LOCUS116299, partial [marine metagenome]
FDHNQDYKNLFPRCVPGTGQTVPGV